MKPHTSAVTGCSGRRGGRPWPPLLSLLCIPDCIPQGPHWVSGLHSAALGEDCLAFTAGCPGVSSQGCMLIHPQLSLPPPDLRSSPSCKTTWVLKPIFSSFHQTVNCWRAGTIFYLSLSLSVACGERRSDRVKQWNVALLTLLTDKTLISEPRNLYWR